MATKLVTEVGVQGDGKDFTSGHARCVGARGDGAASSTVFFMSHVQANSALASTFSL